MRPQQIMFMGWMLAVGTMISLTFGGLWLGPKETILADSLTVFKQANILGTWSVMVPNVSFFLVGVKSLMMMDFAFFRDEMVLIQWFFFLTLGVGFLWGIFMVVISAIRGLFR
ncbi:hypothetical protein ES703_71856 [subsurface metagenome]